MHGKLPLSAFCFLSLLFFFLAMPWAGAQSARQTSSSRETTAERLHVTNVAAAEYKTGYLASDSNFYCFTDRIMQPYKLGKRKILDVAAGFNVLIMLDDEGFVWRNLGVSTHPYRLETDSTDAPFDRNKAIYAYANTYASIRADKSLWYWGDDTLHLYHKSGGIFMRPIQISPAGMKIVKVVMSLRRIIVLTVNGEVWEWLIAGSLLPAKKIIPRPATDIFGSHWNYGGCIIPETAGSTMGYPYVWGTDYGCWGGVTGPKSEPYPLKSMWKMTAPIKEICANYNTTHYIDSLGRLFGIGDNVMGEIGIGIELVNHSDQYPTPYGWSFRRDENLHGPKPYEIGKGIKWKKLFSNNAYVFYKYALDENDSLYFWGRDKALVSGRGFYSLDEAPFPNTLDVLSPTVVHPLDAVFQTYHFFRPRISAGPDKSVRISSATLSVDAKPALLIKSTSRALNGIDTIGYHIVGYAWTQLSGEHCTILSPKSQLTQVTGLRKGNSYSFKVVATDNNTGTFADTVRIRVQP